LGAIAVLALEEKTDVVDRKTLQGRKNPLESLYGNFQTKPLH
jgi:hypothetical protein